jgi:hypothetical protein
MTVPINSPVICEENVLAPFSRKALIFSTAELRVASSGKTVMIALVSALVWTVIACVAPIERSAGMNWSCMILAISAVSIVPLIFQVEITAKAISLSPQRSSPEPAPAIFHTTDLGTLGKKLSSLLANLPAGHLPETLGGLCDVNGTFYSRHAAMLQRPDNNLTGFDFRQGQHRVT